jgi:hypothetical protein
MPPPYRAPAYVPHTIYLPFLHYLLSASSRFVSGLVNRLASHKQPYHNAAYLLLFSLCFLVDCLSHKFQCEDSESGPRCYICKMNKTVSPEIRTLSIDQHFWDKDVRFLSIAQKTMMRIWNLRLAAISKGAQKRCKYSEYYYVSTLFFQTLLRTLSDLCSAPWRRSMSFSRGRPKNSRAGRIP